MLILEHERDLTQITLDFDYYNKLGRARGCFDLGTNEQVPCIAQGEFLPLAVKFAQSSGLMELSVNLDYAEKFGLTPKIMDRNTFAYQVWSSEELANRRLVLQLYPRQYDKVLSLLTGKVFLYEGEQEITQGSANLTQFGRSPFKS
jgi:hypothetical protein